MFFLLVLPLFAFLPALRKDVGGADYFIYEQAYEEQELKFEPLYSLLSLAFNNLGFSFNEFLCIVTLASFLLLIYSIRRNTNYLFLAFLIYLGKLYIFYDFVILRQFIAMPFVWLSLVYLRDNKLALFYKFWFVGFLFHYSAIFVLPIYFIRNRYIPTKYIFMFLLVGLCFNVTFIRFLQFLCDQLPYLSYRLNSYLSKNEGTNIFNFFETLLILFTALLYRKKLYYFNCHTNYYINIFCYSSLLLFFFSSLEDIKRVRDYFVLSYFVIIPLIPYVFKQKHLRFLTYCVIVAYFSLLYVRSFLLFDTTTEIGKLIPYKSFIF